MTGVAGLLRMLVGADFSSGEAPGASLGVRALVPFGLAAGVLLLLALLVLAVPLA